jgi:hypothetical protein
MACQSKFILAGEINASLPFLFIAIELPKWRCLIYIYAFLLFLNLSIYYSEL